MYNEKEPYEMNDYYLQNLYLLKHKQQQININITHLFLYESNEMVNSLQITADSM